MEIFLQILVFCAPALVALFGWGMLKLNQLIAAKVENENLRGVLMRLDDAVDTAVKSVFQTFVKGLKKHEKFDEAAQKEAKEAALAEIKSYLGPKGLSLISKILGWKDADKELGAKVEAKVESVKKEG